KRSRWQNGRRGGCGGCTQKAGRREVLGFPSRRETLSSGRGARDTRSRRWADVVSSVPWVRLREKQASRGGGFVRMAVALSPVSNVFGLGSADQAKGSRENLNSRPSCWGSERSPQQRAVRDGGRTVR